jgi:serine phosphatase RsbU (regulator of sigma subunit)
VLADADFLFRNEAPKDTFCTALVAVIDKENGVMKFASAGHPGPLIWTRGTVTSPLREKRPPLAFGNLTPTPGTPITIDLEPGCTIVFYTDGLIEAQRDASAGEDILRRALLDPAIRNARNPASALRDACVQGAHADDIAVLVMRYEGNR